VSYALDLGAIKEQLEAKRRELLDGVNRARQLTSEESEAGAPDIADRATSAFQRDFSFHMSENEARMLRLIEEALARLQNGRYGLCVSCSEPIEEPRLRALPWARHCIACQELQDRGEL
jgi:DnaK suppressor protein